MGSYILFKISPFALGVRPKQDRLAIIGPPLELFAPIIVKY